MYFKGGKKMTKKSWNERVALVKNLLEAATEMLNALEEDMKSYSKSKVTRNE